MLARRPRRARHGRTYTAHATYRYLHLGVGSDVCHLIHPGRWITAPLRSNATVFCKTDDDSLIHLAHLRSSLEAALRDAPSPYVMYSYIRWRGWLPEHRFQACGGGWGGPADAIHQMEDPVNKCELAEGPFPQGTGSLTCMSRALAVKVRMVRLHYHLITTSLPPLQSR